MFCLGLVLLIIKWCFLKSHRWTKLQLNNVGAQFDTVLIFVCFPWINWEAVMVPYSGACTLAWHCDKSTSQLQLIHKHCKLQVKLSFIASFCSTRASALTYTDYFDINYSLTEPNVLCMSRCLCSCVKQELKTCVCIKILHKCVCLCVCRLMAISLLVNMKNACKADFFSPFFCFHRLTDGSEKNQATVLPAFTAGNTQFKKQRDVFE